MDFQPVQEIFTHVISGQTLKNGIQPPTGSGYPPVGGPSFFRPKRGAHGPADPLPSGQQGLHQTFPRGGTPPSSCGSWNKISASATFSPPAGIAEVKVGKRASHPQTTFWEAGPAPPGTTQLGQNPLPALDNKLHPFLAGAGHHGLGREGSSPRMRDKFNQINRFWS